MKKVLFILPGFNFGGTVVSTLNMISFIADEYDVYVLGMTLQGAIIRRYRDSCIRILPEIASIASLMGRFELEGKLLSKIRMFVHKSLRKSLRFWGKDYDMYLYMKYARILQSEYKFDIVASCQEGAATYFASCFVQCKRIAWFRSEYSVYSKEHPRYLLDRDQVIYPRFDNIVCVSSTTRDDFFAYFPSARERLTAIHNIQNVIEIERNASLPVPDFPNSDFVIVSIGRMSPQKRFSLIPSIAKKLLDAGCSFKWIILGDGNASGEWDKLQSEIKQNGVSDTVLCLGSRLNPYPYISRSHLLVNTSYVEACPRVIVEAKLLKTPVVCADFRSAREFVSSNFDGFVSAIDRIHEPIIRMIKDEKLYAQIKTTCDAYTINNQYILEQLRSLL